MSFVDTAGIWHEDIMTPERRAGLFASLDDEDVRRVRAGGHPKNVTREQWEDYKRGVASAWRVVIAYETAKVTRRDPGHYYQSPVYTSIKNSTATSRYGGVECQIEYGVYGDMLVGVMTDGVGCVSRVTLAPRSYSPSRDAPLNWTKDIAAMQRKFEEAVSDNALEDVLGVDPRPPYYDERPRVSE